MNLQAMMTSLVNSIKHVKEELVPILHRLLEKMEEKGTLTN